MTKATTTVKPTPVKLSDGRHRCLLETCKKPFTPNRSDQCYCKNDKRDCKSLVRKVDRSKTRSKKPYTIPLDAHQRYRILDAVRAAGTVQVLTTWKGDVDEAAATINVLTATNTANLKTGKNTFHTCHVDAVNHSYRLGLLSSKNLFVGLGTRNRATGAFSSGMGSSINRLDLKAKWLVAENMSNADIWTMIEEYVGVSTLTEACRKAGLKPSAKAQALANLELLIDPSNPDHDKYTRVLKNPKSTTVDLQMACAEIQGKRVFSMKLNATSEQEILFSEIRRHSAFRPELEFLLTPINQMYTVHTDEEGKSHKHLIGILDQDHLQTLFNLLQGHDADTMVEEVEELMFGFNFASRKMADDVAIDDAHKARWEALQHYLALSPADRAIIDVQRQEDADRLSGNIYMEDGVEYRVGNPNKPLWSLWHVPGYTPF